MNARQLATGDRIGRSHNRLQVWIGNKQPKKGYLWSLENKDHCKRKGGYPNKTKKKKKKYGDYSNGKTTLERDGIQFC